MLLILGLGNSLSLEQDRPVQCNILVEVVYQNELFAVMRKACLGLIFIVEIGLFVPVVYWHIMK